MSWKHNFEEGKEIILSTASSKGKLNAIIVISLGFVDDKLLIADCQMKTTTDNIKQNSNLCLVGGHYKIEGIGKVQNTGEYFQNCVEKSKEYTPKNAIVVEIEHVFDLDKVNKII